MRTLKLLLILGLFPALLLADQPRVGSTTGQILKLNTSARSSALGGAFLALADDPAAAFYNPSGLVRLEGNQVLLTHTMLPADISYECGAASFKLNETNTLGFTFGGLYTDEMDVTTPYHPGGTGETFVYSAFHGGLSFGRWMTDRFSFGAGVRYLRINLMDSEYTVDTWNGYLGSLYDVGYRDTRFGVVIGNFGPDIEFISEAYGQPLFISVGVLTRGYAAGDHYLDFVAEASKPKDATEQYSMGAEYWYRGMLALRTGYRFGHDSLSWAGGLGINIGSGDVAFRLDYAYVDMDLLGENHQISLTAAF